MSTPESHAAYADELRDTIDALALNLTNYGHTWSPELRSAYERVIALLERSQNWTLHGDPDGPFPASEPKATVKTKPGETTVTVDFRGRRGVSAECKKLRGPNDTGPDCGCRGDACALGRDAASNQRIAATNDLVEKYPLDCPNCGLWLTADSLDCPRCMTKFTPAQLEAMRSV